MINNPRDAIGVALKYLGYSYNTTDKAQITEAVDLLVEQKPLVQTYVMDEIFDKLESGEAAQAVLDVPESVRAPVYPGMHLGTAKLVVDGQVYGVGEVVASERVRADGIRMDVRRIVAHWTL